MKLKMNSIVMLIIGIAATFLSATKIDPVTLTNWDLLGKALLNFLSNPFLIGCFLIAIWGQFNNPNRL